MPSGPYRAESLLQRFDARTTFTLLSLVFASFPSSVSTFCLSFTVSIFWSSITFLFLTHKVSYSLYIQKQHIPLRLHKVALLPPPPLCAGLFLHSFTLLITLSFLHLFLLIPPSKAFLYPPVSLLPPHQPGLCFCYLLSFHRFFFFFSLVTSFFSFPLSCLQAHPLLSRSLSPLSDHLPFSHVSAYCCRFSPPIHLSPLFQTFFSPPYLSFIPLWPVAPWPRQCLCPWGPNP